MVSDPGDRFELEAEHTADRVMAGEAPVIGGVGAVSSAVGVQREDEDKLEDEPPA